HRQLTPSPPIVSSASLSLEGRLAVHGQVRRQVLEGLVAKALDPAEVPHPLELAVLLAELEHAQGLGRAHARKELQLLLGGGVEVELAAQGRAALGARLALGLGHAGGPGPGGGAGSRRRVHEPPRAPRLDVRRELGRTGIAVSPLAVSGVFELPPGSLVEAYHAGVSLFFWEPRYAAMT